MPHKDVLNLLQQEQFQPKREAKSDTTLSSLLGTAKRFGEVLISGEKFLGAISGGRIQTSELPGALGLLKTPIDIAAAPLSLLTAGLGGGAFQALRAVPRIGRAAGLIEPFAGVGQTGARGLATRVGGELGVGLAATGASRAAEQLPVPEKFKTPVSLAAGLIGGVGAAGAISRTARRKVLRTNVGEEDTYAIFDPTGEVQEVTGILIPSNRVIANEELLKIRNLEADNVFETINPFTRGAIKDWFNGDPIRLRSAFKDANLAAKDLYASGAGLRQALRTSEFPKFVNPDGTITLYRGEAEFKFKSIEEMMVPPPVGEDTFRLSVSRATINEPQILQSYTPDPKEAAQFSSLIEAETFGSGIGSLGVGEQSFISARRIHIDDIVAPIAQTEGEILVLSRELLDDTTYEAITGTTKLPIPRVDVGGRPIPALGFAADMTDDDIRLIQQARENGIKFTPKIETRIKRGETLHPEQRRAITRGLREEGVAGVESPTPAGFPENFDNLTRPDTKGGRTEFPVEGDPIFESTYVDGRSVAESLPPAIELKQGQGASRVIENAKLPEELQNYANDIAKSSDTGIGLVNQFLKTIWATADMSWFGIQGLLAVPRLVLTGKGGQAGEIFSQSLKSMTDETVFARFINRYDDVARQQKRPTVAQMVKDGELHLSSLAGLEDIGVRGSGLPIIGAANRVFAVAGDIARINSFGNEWRAGIDMLALGRAINRATGIGAGGVPGADFFKGESGRILLFAPRFLQSQLEVVAKVFTDGGLEGNLARKQVASLIGTGVTLTWLANEIRGEETVFNPKSSNFMRVRNVGGVDVSLFGPWDSLIRAVSHASEGDFAYIARTKASPIISTAWSLFSGETFLGEDARNPVVMAKGLLLPFAFQEVGREPLIGTAAGFFGVKATPLSPTELLDNKITNSGGDPLDPITRREWLADHPEDLLKSRSADRELAEETREDIESKRQLNDANAVGNVITLSGWRENRKLLNKERRDKLRVILGEIADRSPRNQQEEWLQSYFELFEAPGVQDPITGDPLAEVLDPLQARWLAENGEEALDYVNRYSLIGKSDIETQYLNDLSQLDDLGFFNLSRLVNMRSGLPEEQILDYSRQVSAIRNTDPRLRQMDFAQAARIYLSSIGLDSTQIRDVINSGRDRFQNPELVSLKELYPELVAWFSPVNTWSTLQSLQVRTGGVSAIRAPLTVP